MGDVVEASREKGLETRLDKCVFRREDRYGLIPRWTGPDVMRGNILSRVKGGIGHNDAGTPGGGP